MKNVIFISPNFPTNYWMFCKELKENGLTSVQGRSKATQQLLKYINSKR